MTYKDITGAGLARAGYSTYFDNVLNRQIHYRKNMFKSFVEFNQKESTGGNELSTNIIDQLNKPHYVRDFMYTLDFLTPDMNNIMRHLLLSNNVDYTSLHKKYPIESKYFTFNNVDEKNMVSEADILYNKHKEITIIHYKDPTLIDFLHNVQAINKHKHSIKEVINVMMAVGYKEYKVIEHNLLAEIKFN